MANTVLVVDDEKNILLSLGQALTLAGYKTELAQSAQVALDVLTARPVDVVLMDVRMPDADGLTTLSKMMAERPGLPVLMMSGHATIETAVRATQLGARDFLEKPIARDRLLVALRNALEHRAVVEELNELRSLAPSSQMLGKSPAMETVRALVAKIAPSEGRVLITGENGTGKELVARALHDSSRRKAGPFIKLNCAAVPHELIESELFGHERGAFTGAVGARRGKFELANEGTLFLDEVGDMPQSMQAKLLRVLQEGELERVGGSETLKVDVRVVAATNRDLERAVTEGKFREDLYYRLNVVRIHTPALRERREDIATLIGSFLTEACHRNGKRPLSLSTGAMQALAAHDYPGNVRELRNLVERVAILCEGPVVSEAEVAVILPAQANRPPRAAAASSLGLSLSDAAPVSIPVTQPNVVPVAAPASEDVVPSVGESVGVRYRPDKTFREQVEDAERDLIVQALAYTKDNVTEAARLLDLERGHFYKKMKALGLKRGTEKDV